MSSCGQIISGTFIVCGEGVGDETQYCSDACQIEALKRALQRARDAGPIMWTCDTCGFSCDIATEPLGTGDACMACENKAFRARLGIES